VSPASCRIIESKVKQDFKENEEMVKMHLSNMGLAGLVSECEKNKGTVTMK